jgi:hypothetical protein
VSSTRKSRFIYGTPQTVQARYKTDTARYKTDKARYKTVKTRYKTVKARFWHMYDSQGQILALVSGLGFQVNGRKTLTASLTSKSRYSGISLIRNTHPHRITIGPQA